MSTAKKRLAEFLHLDFLQEHAECAFFMEWRDPRGDKQLLCAPGFEARYIDDDRELAVIVATADDADFEAQHGLLESMEWLDCYSEVVIVKVSRDVPEDVDQALFRSEFMNQTAVSVSDEQHHVLVFHLADDLTCAAQHYKVRSALKGA
jgi:hypothetical protein